MEPEGETAAEALHYKTGEQDEAAAAAIVAAAAAAEHQQQQEEEEEEEEEEGQVDHAIVVDKDNSHEEREPLSPDDDSGGRTFPKRRKEKTAGAAEESQQLLPEDTTATTIALTGGVTTAEQDKEEALDKEEIWQETTTTTTTQEEEETTSSAQSLLQATKQVGPTIVSLPELDIPDAHNNHIKRQQQQQPNAPSTAAAATAAAASSGNHQNHHNNNDDDDDVTSKAALALAAVAAAANAKNKSPAEAAREARAVAQSFISTAAGGGAGSPGGSGGKSPPEGRNTRTSRGDGTTAASSSFQTVSLSAVRTNLRRRSLETTGSKVLDKLSQGDNDCFLQVLLLMEHFRCVDDININNNDNNNNNPNDDVVAEEEEEENGTNIAKNDGHQDDDDEEEKEGSSSSLDPPETSKEFPLPPTQEEHDDNQDHSIQHAAYACERLEAILKRVEGAYDSLLNLLPTSAVMMDPFGATAAAGDGEEGSETPVVIPDLLPPCAPPNGDPTVAFFKACMGELTSAGRFAKMDGDASFANESKEEESSSPAAEQSSESLGHHAHTSKEASASHSSSSGNKQSSVFSSMFKRSPGRGSLGGVFRRKSNRGSSLTARSGEDTIRTVESTTDASSSSSSAAKAAAAAAYATATTPADMSKAGEYEVKIERELLGLTVENVLERTVVRTVAPTGPAKKAGAKVGSLIVKVGNVETKNLTHFETIDELRQSNRPLQLVLRQISEESLRSAREEMGRLIKGAGFGNMMEGNRFKENADLTGGEAAGEIVRPLIEADLRIDAYTNLIRRRFAEARQPIKNKKEEALAKVGEKLVWILTLFVVGLERESKRLFALAETIGEAASPASPRRNPHSTYHHTAKDYADAAKSVSKVLYDYTRKNLDPETMEAERSNLVSTKLGAGRMAQRGLLSPPVVAGRGRGGKRQPMAPGRASNEDSSLIHEKPLLQVGDVLQRTRTFLADTTSPPAALLRGELISFLCDVLDVDTDMELADEETESATAGRNAATGGITDLGSAGSLLKLIVLSCPIMRSPCCEEVTTRLENDPDLEEELKRRFGTRQEFSTADLHRLHAGNRFLAIVHRLAASRSTSARITACSLGPVLWGHLDFPHQLQLRGVITRALHDVEVMVRKATATVLHEIAELVFDPRSVPWLVLMCERAMTDPDPQLRASAMTLTWHLAEHLPNAFLGDASQGSRYLRRLPSRDDPTFAEVYLLQCKLLPVATRLAEDRSPSVRLAVAAQCDRLCDALGAHWSSVVIDALLALLSDADEKVRCEAVSCVPRLAQIVLLSTSPGETVPSEISILEALIPASIKLQKDKSVSVRVALAAAAGDLLTLLVGLQSRTGEPLPDQASSEPPGETYTNKNYKRHVDDRLIPLVQTLLNDSDPEVTSSALRAVTNATRSSASHSRARLTSMDDDASISSFASHASREKPVFLPVLSEVQVLRLLPTLTELGNSRQWRVRQSAVEIVPALLGCTQKLETRSEIAKLCVRLMGDKVDAVRKTAAECLCLGGSSLGSHGEDASAEWISSIVIPTIRRASIHTESKQRLLSLKMVEVLLQSGACPPKWKGEKNKEERMTDSPIRELAAIALSLTNDRIANVRLNVGRCLETVIHVFEDDEVSFIQEVLLQQIESEKSREGGADPDVLYFAEQCVKKARKEKAS